jgi:hypothetical protein
MTPLDTLLAACRKQHLGLDIDQATHDFQQQALTDTAILTAAAAALPSLPPLGADRLALAIGANIEMGPGAEKSGPGLLDFFKIILRKLPDEHALEKGVALTPDQNAWLDALPNVCRATVAHLARLPQLRAELAQDAALLERLRSLQVISNGAGWVLQALLCTSGPLLLLHPSTNRGVRVRYRNVSNCFHLFSLIQVTLGESFSGGRIPDPDVAEAVLNPTHHLTDSAWWHYGMPNSKTSEMLSAVWGEGHPQSIPTINGVQVMLLWPPILNGRTWDAGFFAPHLQALPASMTLEETLPAQECTEWFKLLGIEATDKA